MRPLLVDDCFAALSFTSPLGQDLLRSPIARLREEFLLFATRRQWGILNHGDFSRWVGATPRSDVPWLVLDPLLRPAQMPGNAQSVRISRVLTPAGIAVLGGVSPKTLRGSAKDFAVVDDAAVTGVTLKHLAIELAELGCRVSTVVVGSSSAAARAALDELFTGVEWASYVTGDARAIHCRDGCLGLPFAGKRTTERVAVEIPGGTVPVYIRPTAFAGLWQDVAQDRTLMLAMRRSAERARVALKDFLRREPVVADLRLLGDDVGIAVDPRQGQVTPKLPLAEII